MPESIIQSLIMFGGSLFPFGAWVKSRETKMDLDITPMLGLDGTVAPTGKLDAHIVTISMLIGAAGDFDPSSTLEDILYLMSVDDLNNSLNNFFAALYGGPSQLTLGYTSPARTINAQYRGFKINYTEATGRRNATVDLDFYCQDPRWLDTNTKSITSDGTATSDGNLRSYPVVTYTQTGGDADTDVVLKVYPGAGSGYVELTLDLANLGGPEYMQEGDVLVITCAPRLRAIGIQYTPNGDPTEDALASLGTDGIVNTIGNNATFPYLLPGDNTVSFAGANSIEFAWQDAYAL